jgi:hypothetical protein
VSSVVPAVAFEIAVAGADAEQVIDANAVVGEIVAVAVALIELAAGDRPFDAHPLSVSSLHQPTT